MDLAETQAIALKAIGMYHLEKKNYPWQDCMQIQHLVFL